MADPTGKGCNTRPTMGVSAKRIVVMGLGRFGGGVGVARFLATHGADVLVTDLQPADRLGQSLAQLDGLPIGYRLGCHVIHDFTDADLIVVNPAVDRRENRFLCEAMEAGVGLTSEMRLLISALPTGVGTIGVTGTAGKSTVSAMTGHILARGLGDGHVFVGGNLGGSLLDRIDQIQDGDWVVLELSSFMLEDLACMRWSPHIAVATNLTANHLDRHGSFEAYAKAKQVIFDYQTPSDYAVLGPDIDQWLTPRAGRIDRVAGLPEAPIPLVIPGDHNQLNAVLAICAAGFAGVGVEQATQALSDFPGLPHRLQLVCEYNGIRFYNDSKSTTPQSSERAICSFDCVQKAEEAAGIHVILGGYDKGIDLAGLGRFAGQRCRGVYTIGATGDAVALAAQGGSAGVFRCGSLDRAVESASRHARRGEVVLLSPGCASWDQFENYEQRGGAFVESILKYNTEREPLVSDANS